MMPRRFAIRGLVGFARPGENRSRRLGVARPHAIILLCAGLAACAMPRQGQIVQQPTPRVSLPAAPPPGEPGDLAGLQPAQLRVLMGDPAFIRKDGPAEMWRYDGPNCKAFFFLYPYGTSLLVRHVETLPRGRDIAADQTCLGSLRARSPVPVS